MNAEQIAELEAVADLAVDCAFPILDRNQGKMLVDLIATAKEVIKLRADNAQLQYALERSESALERERQR